MAKRQGILAGAAVMVCAMGAYYLVMGRTLPQDTTAPASEHSGTAMVDVLVPTRLSDKAGMGKRAFDASCAECHGSNAAGQQGVAPPLIHKIYEPRHHGDMAFLLAAQNGVRSHHWRFGDMPPVPGLTRSDMENIVVYVREVQRENGIN